MKLYIFAVFLIADSDNCFMHTVPKTPTVQTQDNLIDNLTETNHQI